LVVLALSSPAVLAEQTPPLRPSDPDNLAIAAAQRDRFRDALTDFSTAVAGTYGDEREPLVSALARMAAAVAEWDGALRRASDDLSSTAGNGAGAAQEQRAALASAYLDRAQLAAALRELDAVRSDLRSPDTHLLRGLALEMAGRSSEALDAFRAAWRARPDPITAYRLLQHLPPDDTTKEARRALDVMAEAYRGILAGDSRRASSPFREAGPFHASGSRTVLPPSSAYAAGYRLVAQGALDEAIVQFRTAAALDPLLADPASGSTRMMKGIAALRRGRLREARSFVEAALALTPGSSEAHRVLAVIYWADRQYRPSVEHLEAAIRTNPDDERSRLMLARVQSSAGRHAEAERTLRQTIERLPDSLLAHWWLGSLYEETNRISEARQEYARAAGAASLSARFHVYASVALTARVEGDFAGAVEAFARRIRFAPNAPVAHRQLADLYLEQDLGAAAFAELVAALLVDPHDADAYAAIGRIQLDDGRPADAASALARALELNPRLADARYALAMAMQQSGRSEQAARELEIVERAGRAAISARRRDLAIQVIGEEAALREAQGAFDEAAGLWRQLVEREPQEPAHRLNLASALVNAGRIDDAIEQYETAAALGTPDAYRQLSALYARVGRVEDSARAGALYERARAQEPGSGESGR
jgi:tetratricopeptide (TPR) repeat protein